MPRSVAKEIEYVTMRQKVLATFCPYCSALPGNRCMGRTGKLRLAMHSDRWEAYRNLANTPKGTAQ